MREPLHQIRRLAVNLDRYRKVNAEWMAKPGARFDARAISTDFFCECARASCRETITLTLSEYEAVRANPHQFFVCPSNGHVFGDAERIIEAHSRYFVVERIAADTASNGTPPLSAARRT